MNLPVSLREITAAVAALMLFGACALTATTAIRQPSGMHAILEVWADIARDVDSVGLAVTRVSPKEEQAVGDAIARQVEQSFASPSDAALQPYIGAVGQRLLRAMAKTPLTYSFKVIDAPEINAFALPGGHVYVTTGLLAALHSEAALAAVLGHEISHVSLGHCIGRLQYELAARRIAGDDFAEIVGFAHQLFSAAYNREQETEADRNGVLLAAAAGYDPRAVIDAMRLLASMETQAEQAGTVGGQILQSVGETIGDYARSHPPAEQRIADLETLIERNASTWQGKQFYLGAREYAQAVTHEPGDYHDWRVFTSAQPAPSIPPSFPDLTGRVVDQADVIPSKVKAVIDNRLALIEWETGDKFVVATVRSLQGYDIHDYGFRLSQHWGGPGKDGKSVLLVVAPGEHQVDIEFGYGVRLSGAQAKEIIQKTIQPRFDAGDIIAGIERGVDDVIRVLSGNAIEIDGRAVSAASGTPASPSARSASLGPTFPDLTGRVVDQADVIPAKIKAAIEEKLATFEEATTNQFVVATVKSLEDYAIPTYARQLGQHWDIFGVGNKGKGVLLVVAPNEHQVDIEVGYGLNMTLSAAQAQEIIQKTILPRLLADDMAGGIERGVDEMIQILAGKE